MRIEMRANPAGLQRLIDVAVAKYPELTVAQMQTVSDKVRWLYLTDDTYPPASDMDEGGGFSKALVKYVNDAKTTV